MILFLHLIVLLILKIFNTTYIDFNRIKQVKMKLFVSQKFDIHQFNQLIK